MKYFIDTEFIEGFHCPVFGKRRHYIDLISIGIVCEDNRTYYAISSEYNFKDASAWVKDNVITPLYLDTVHGDARNHFSKDNFHKRFGITNYQIAVDIFNFCKPVFGNEMTFSGISVNMGQLNVRSAPEFYGYFSDYDWVLFCSLFGKMIELPKGWPMYCRDLKQTLDEKAAIIAKQQNESGGVWDINHALTWIKSHALYPTNKYEHNALADAKWNYELYNFLTSGQVKYIFIKQT